MFSFRSGRHFQRSGLNPETQQLPQVCALFRFGVSGQSPFGVSGQSKKKPLQDREFRISVFLVNVDEPVSVVLVRTDMAHSVFPVKDFGGSGQNGRGNIGVSGWSSSVFLANPSVFPVRSFGVSGQKFGVFVRNITEKTVQHANGSSA